jgi:GNAT superfamily N-acetyltransferase
MEMVLRQLVSDDKPQFCKLLYDSFNTWYKKHGLNDQYFRCPPEDLGIVYDIYEGMKNSHSIAAFDQNTGRLMGACFYHPRATHISLGIMSVHPDYWKLGVGKSLLSFITDYADNNNFESFRLMHSACNVDSFSLYSKGGFSPRYSYHDMLINVPEQGLDFKVKGSEKVRTANEKDVPEMAGLEMELSGIFREEDYLYCVKNELGFWSTLVLEDSNGGLNGFMISCGHSSLNILGPGVAKSEEDAMALIYTALNQYKNRTPLVLVPTEKRKLVESLYEWGAWNCEIHFHGAKGAFHEFKGVNIPTFLPETG